MRRPHCCAALVGLALLLLAVVVSLRLHTGTTTDRLPTRQALVNVQDAVIQLEGGCLTCHLTLNDPARNDSLAVVHSAPVQDAVTPYEQMVYNRADIPSPSQAEIDEQLHDLGQDILTYAAYSQGDEREIAEAFLATYHATRDLNPTIKASSVRRIQVEIDTIRDMLRDPEHQANPYHMAKRTVTQTDVSTAVIMPTSSAPTLAALLQQASILPVSVDSWASFENSPALLPVDTGFAMHRRGPPSDAYSDSVWTRRLPSSSDGPSPFIFLEDNNLHRASAGMHHRQQGRSCFSFAIRRSYVS